MSISKDEKELITNLIADCNELIDGKFILADSKISKILKDIADSQEVFNLLGECMTNFNFEKEFARAKIKLPTRPGYFKIPEEKYKLLPMVFCVLVDIDNRKIDFPLFLKEYFSTPDNEISEYRNFCDELIKPFRNAISELFDLPLIISERMQKQKEKQSKLKAEEDHDENEVLEEKTEMNEEDEKLFEDITRIVGEIISTVETDWHLKDSTRDNALIMLNGMIRSCELKDLKLLNALLIGFEPIGPIIKSIRFVYKELKDRMIDYYSEM